MESTRKRRQFPEALRLKAASAIRGGRTVSQVAAELGLPDRLVQTWLRWPATHGQKAMTRCNRASPGARSRHRALLCRPRREPRDGQPATRSPRGVDGVRPQSVGTAC